MPYTNRDSFFTHELFVSLSHGADKFIVVVIRIETTVIMIVLPGSRTKTREFVSDAQFGMQLFDLEQFVLRYCLLALDRSTLRFVLPSSKINSYFAPFRE